MSKHFTHYAGVTLIELMVSMLLGILLSLAVVQLYITNSQTNQANQDLARLQENGRYILYRLSTELRMTGYMGCLKSDPSKLNVITSGINSVPSTSGPPALSAADLAARFEQPVQGTENGTSDEIILSHAVSDAVAQVSSVSGTTYTAANVGNLVGTSPDNILMITDCEKAVIFVPNGTVATNTVRADNISASFQAGAEIMKATSTRFFITNVGTPAVPTFSQQVNGGATQNLIENVESMQILYGEDTDSTNDNVANTYRRANQISDWSRVVSVRIIITLVTPTRGNQPVTRLTMSMTVDVRNR